MASKLYLGFLWVITLFRGPQASKICDLVDTAIPDRISYPASASYVTAQSSYYSAHESEIRPACILTPESPKEVSRFVELVTRQAANSPRSHPVAKFAIRGGGHAVFAGAANIESGITVDMRALSSVSLSDDRKTATIGAGAIWSEIYPQLVPYNVTVMGGRVAGVGVGGVPYWRGWADEDEGGISHLSRRYGWACDNVLGYEVVLASGEIVYATASSHPDLWIALKGGSINFGIVARVDVVTRPLGAMWGGTLIFEYSPILLDTQAKAFSEFMSPENFDDAADMFVALFFINPGGIYAAGNVLYYGEPIANPPVYQPFSSIPSPLVNTLRTTNVSDLSTEQASRLPVGSDRAINMVYSFKNAAASVYSEIFETWESATRDLAHIEGLQFVLLLQPHPVSDGRNSLGLPPGGEDIVMSVIIVSYSNTADDKIVRKRLKEVFNQHEDILRRGGYFIPWKYLNYADKLQDPIGSYGHDIKCRLQGVSKKYDPNGLFQTIVPGGFKLFQEEMEVIEINERDHHSEL
ncbi:Bifunctional solanapyrone synthase [Penicillium malachiteum]|uniref:Bifunctional solanapyrone synthase n=1 Tax=Penicillium malachiteum TaxID=1324776 RepID=UPI002546B405|nr:Bifunctional solanapyrone synthase [Penicillium malachiteum]KAJ5736907.1 Bifunctional solanapyrone synthase [Penicillium malachiteum]